MDIELLEIRDFLVAHHPFDQLPGDVLDKLPAKIQIRYFRREANIPEEGDLRTDLYLVRTGAVELHDADGDLMARLGEGDVFGYRITSFDSAEGGHGAAIEDSLIYQLSAVEVDKLCDAYPPFAYFFKGNTPTRLKDGLGLIGNTDSEQVNQMMVAIGDIINRDPITITAAATIQQTAETMSSHKVSSILVVDENDSILGIVTDRDLRTRVVAKGLDYGVPISEIMTRSPLTVDIDDYAFEAQLLMARQNIHHLPVMRSEKVAGMLTATDLTKHHTTSAVYLVSDIFKQTEISQMQAISAKIPQLLLSMASAEATADSIGHVITAVTDAITTRLLNLAEQKLGPPPVPYAWVAAGSQARNEQTAKSDQDNCLILDDGYDEQKHGEYFRELSRFVCDGLNACGYVYCPGEMMALTDQWRQPLKTWKHYFTKWIDQPEPKALMLVCIFFDLRFISGEPNLFRKLRSFVLQKTRGNRIFLAYMAGNALSHQPPLGFFRNFVLIKGGEHDHTFDLKHTGLVPIVDLARVYALAAGSQAVNTLERLEVVAEGGEVSEDGARDLSDALEFISDIRIAHQARLIRSGEKPNNYMSPDDLSHFERNQLKDAFSVVRTMQNVLSQRYQR